MTENSLPNIWVYDAEVFPNHVMCGFKEVTDLGDGAYLQFERGEYADGTIVDTMSADMLAFINDEIDRKSLFVGFNNIFYDDLVVSAMCAGKAVSEVYKLSGDVIAGRVVQKWGANPMGWRRVDLFKMLNGASLKNLGVMMGHHRLQELPYPFDTSVDRVQSANVVDYNRNDLDVTEKLLRKLATALQMRQALEADYQFADGTLTSRHDAGLAKDIVRAEYESRVNAVRTTSAPIRMQKPAVSTTWSAMGHELIDPRFTFDTAPALARIRDHMAKTPFSYQLREIRKPKANAQGFEQERVVVDTASKRFGGDFRFRGVTYTVGVGGLHSKDSGALFVSDEFSDILSIDVASMYPNLIMQSQVAPSHLDAAAFLDSYKDIIARRLAAKKLGQAGDASAKLIDVGLKIAINSVYGSFKEANSANLDPLASLRVTLNGQLFLLETIRRLTDAGVEILSANTDGLYVRAPKGVDCKAILDGVTVDFGLVFEIEGIERYYRKSVSDYVLKFADGKIKCGGDYNDAHGDLKRKGDHSICVVAAVAFLLNDTPVEETIKTCRDINRFIASTKVNEAFFPVDGQGNLLPQVLRWYETTAPDGTMLFKVRHSDHKDRAKFNDVKSAKLCLDLPAAFPDDVNVDYYVKAATVLVDKILRPVAKKAPRKAKPIDLLSDDEQDQLSIRRNTTGVSVEKLAKIDLTQLIKDYDGRIRGNSYQGMKYVMASLCHKHPLNADELFEIGTIVDQNAQKFLINESKKRELRKMATYFAANTNPYEADTLEQEEIGLDVYVGDIPCGGGKTYMATNMVAASAPGSVWWWGIDKIDPIAAEREAELKEAFVRNKTAAELDFVAIHSEAEGAGRMIERILRRQHFIETEMSAGNPSNRIFVTIITHKTILDNELEDVTGNIIIDEPISVWQPRVLNLVRSHRTAFDLLKPFDLKEEEITTHEVVGEFKAIRLGLTRQGDEIVADDKFKEDSMFSRFYWVCKQASRTNNRVYVMEHEWNALGDEQDNLLHLMVTLTPAHLRNFDSVFMFAAEFDQLFIRRIWEDVYKARFHKLDMSASWQRKTPLEDRVTVFYALANRPVSKTYLEANEKANARSMADAVLRHWGSETPFIWSTNESFRSEMAMPPKVVNKFGVTVDSYLSPRSNGINQFSNIHRAAWLGSIKLPGDMTTIIREVYGEDAKQALLDNFELYAIYQFANRINVRDFNSPDPVEIIVADKVQAEYLARVMRLPTGNIKPLPVPDDINLQDAAPTRGGRATTGYSKMTPEEKKDYERKKKKESRARAAAKKAVADPSISSPIISTN